MAAKTFYLVNGVDDFVWQALSESTQSAVNTNAGWVVGTGSTNHSELAADAERASSTFTSTTPPDGTFDLSLRDAFRSPSPLTGSFASGNWTFQFAVRSPTQGGAADGRIRFRLLKADFNGNNPTEITSGQQQASLVSNVTSAADSNSTLTVNPGAFSITNQYLFIQVAWERTGAGGMTTTNIRFRTGSAATPTGTVIVTSDFAPTLEPSTLTEDIKIADTVTAEIPTTSLDRDVNAEALVVQDQLLTGMVLDAAVVDEGIRLADAATTTLDPLESAATESLKVQDNVSAAIVEDISASVTEALRMRDGFAIPPESLRVEDAATASRVDVGGGDLSRAIADETLLLADTLTAARDLTTTLVEDLKLSDALTAEITPLQQSADETLKLSDAVTASRDLTASLVEDLKLTDVVSASRGLTTELIETILLADAATTALTPEQASIDETLRLADAVLATLTPLEATATESLKIADTLDAAILIEAAINESLKLSDAVNALLNPEATSATETVRISDAVSVTLDPEQTTQAESLRLADTVTALLNPEEASLTESLNISDAVTAFVATDISASVAESFRVMDFVFGAARFVASQNTRTAGLMENPLKLSDTVAAAVGLSVVVGAESVRIADTLAALSDTLVATVSEDLKLADAVSATEDPLEASHAESLKLAHAVSASRDSDASLAEAMALADVLSAARGLDALVADELRIADTVSTARDLSVDVGESLVVRDTDLQLILVAAGAVFTAETLLLSDTLQAQVDTLSASIVESLILIEIAPSFTLPLRVISSMRFGDEALSAGAFSGESLSLSSFGNESLSEPMFGDEELLPS